MDLTLALRSPGSALKPFIYAMAFEEGVAHPQTVLEDRPHRYGLYAPENFDQTFQGTITARKALQMSLNVPAVDLLNAVGPQRFVSRMRSAGAASRCRRRARPPRHRPGRCRRHAARPDAALRWLGAGRGGDAARLPHGRSARREGLRAARGAGAGLVRRGRFARRAAAANAVAGRIAYKTGTSYGYRDAWSVGFDRKHTIGVWVGRADNGAVPGLVGRLVAAPILFDAFARIGLDAGVGPRPATPSSSPRRTSCRCRSATCGATCPRRRSPSPPPASSSPSRPTARASRWWRRSGAGAEDHRRPSALHRLRQRPARGLLRNPPHAACRARRRRVHAHLDRRRRR